MAAPSQSRTAGNRLEHEARRAVIEIGTNSVKLLVADVGHTLKPVLKLSLQTRLGQDAFRSLRLRPDAIARTVDAVAAFAAEAAALRSTSICVLATSAARETTNGHEFVQAVQSASGLAVDVVSGEEEAEYVFRGVVSDPAIGAQPLLIVDVGGGSTEWVVGESGVARLRKSTRLGTTRLLEAHPPGDPPKPEVLARFRAAVSAFLQVEVLPCLTPILRSFGERRVRLVGLGGALRTLARLSSSPAVVDSRLCSVLRRDQVVGQVERLWGLSLQERRQLVGLNPQKAEVILAGAVIHEGVLNAFGFDEMVVSSRGLREGALLAQAAKNAGAVSSAGLPLAHPSPAGSPRQAAPEG